MAKKPNATREFKTQTPQRKRTSNSRSSAAYHTARIARERQKREIERQKREKMMFALFIVVILVMLLFAILVFKKVLGTDDPSGDITDANDIIDLTDDTGEDEKDELASQAYVSVAKSAVHTGSLILVNSENAYVPSQISLKNIYESKTQFYSKARGKNVSSYYTVDRSPELEENALAALNALADAFYQATGNNDLYITTAYASGSDEHATGLALDLSIYTLEEKHYALDDAKFADIYDWFFDNYYKYGFVISSDSDHGFCFRYVGTPHAYYMHKHDLSLDEYLKLIRKETLAYTDNNGDKYEVYYVHATGDVVSVPLYSADAEYKISGDNSEGLIVTVKVN